MHYLDLGDCKDAAQVWINGRSAGVRIGYPYRFDVSQGSRCGENHIRIEVATTLVNIECDKELVGKIIDVKIVDAKTWSLMGEVNGK